jgi:hypothetical protein
MPHWVAAGNSAPATPAVGVVQNGDAIAPHVDAELNAALDPERDPPLRLRVVHHVGGATSTLIVTWYHPLMDPRGAEHLVAWLASVDAATDGPWRGDTASLVAPPDRRPLRARGTIAMKGLPPLREIERNPPRSLVGDAQPAGPVRWRQVACTAPADGGGHSDELTYRLAVVGRGVAELFARRGLSAIDYVVPIAVDRRRKGAAGPVIGNYIGIHFARFPSDVAREPAAVARDLRAQMADALRHDRIQASWVGMDLLRHLPVSFALRDLRRALYRDVCSFNCADTGSFALGMDELLGATVRNAYHVPSVYPRPGLGVFLNRCGGRHNVVVVWVDGTVEPAEVTRLIEIVQEGLRWTVAA